MNLDTFIEIGSQHKVCEDYIISGRDPVPYIILSDGCSTANNTEMGARILCHLAKQFLLYNRDDLHHMDYWKLGMWVIHNAEQTARQLGLSRSCLTATLIVAYHLDNNLRIMIYGDGSFVTVGQMGSIEITSVEFESNAPYYLVYAIDQFRSDLYNEKSPDKFVNKIYGDASSYKEQFAYDHPLVYNINTTLNPLVLVMSDGVDSFLHHTEPQPAEQIMPLFTNFKNIKGEFLKRRLNKQMKSFEKSGIHHYDDFSIGAFLKVEEM